MDPRIRIKMKRIRGSGSKWNGSEKLKNNKVPYFFHLIKSWFSSPKPSSSPLIAFILFLNIIVKMILLPLSLFPVLRIRIQVNIITKLILKYLLKVKKTYNFQVWTFKTLEISYFFRFRLEKYNFPAKKNKKKKLLVKLCFSLHFIPLDPDPRT